MLGSQEHSLWSIKDNKDNGFTLIELLVVIAILAVLATAVVLVINPAQLLAQGRDSTRLSDLAALNDALSLFQTDQYDQGLGQASTTYVSIPDSSPTCADLGLPSLPSGWTYHCAPTSTYTNVNGTGWIPVNFNLISSGSPLSKLPVDPVNTTSSGEYYTYTAGGSYELTAIPESEKYRAQFQSNPDLPDFPGVIAMGSDMNLSPLYNTQGLVGYWPLDGNANDMSGNGNNGTWYGTPSGSNGYYSTGNGQQYAGYFNGTDDYIGTNSFGLSSPDDTLTFSLWMKSSLENHIQTIFADGSQSGTAGFLWFYRTAGEMMIYQYANGSATGDVGSPGTYFSGYDGEWVYVTVVVDYANGVVEFYRNASLVQSSTVSAAMLFPSAPRPKYIGSYNPSAASYRFDGFIDDVRMYNRALSPAEIQAMYDAEK